MSGDRSDMLPFVRGVLKRRGYHQTAFHVFMWRAVALGDVVRMGDAELAAWFAIWEGGDSLVRAA